MLHKHHRIIPLTILFLAASGCDRLPLSLGYGVDDLLGDDGSGSAGSGGSSNEGEPVSCLDEYDGCMVTTGDSDGCLDQLSHCDATGIVPGSGGSAGSDGTGDPTGTGGFAGAGGTSGVGGGTGDNECFTTYQLCLESGEDPSVCLEAQVRCQDANRLPDGTFGTGGFAGTSGYAGAGAGGGSAGTSTGGFAGAGGGSAGGFAGAGGGSAGTSAGGSAGSGASSNYCYTDYLVCLDSDETTLACLDALGACQTGIPAEGNAGTGAGASAGN